ncbi:MAG: valine--tRNA ligase [Phycisphaeraceae bacterium]
MTRAQPDLPSMYRPADVETEVLERWLAAKAFHARPDDPGEAYSIVIPPPNVTAALHLGHALNNTLQDVLTRYHRMLGRNALWMPGTDHAGIATQTVVDRRLQQEGQPSLKDYKQREARGEGGREAFVQKVQAWKDEYEAEISSQLKRMGCSCDYDRQRFTMDPVCAAAVREAFFRLFKDGLIYRGKRLVNWDPVTQTALADDEVEMREVDGSFWYMKYPIVERQGVPGSGIRDRPNPEPGSRTPASDGWRATGEHVTVATTRPETMLGDTAVAVNPDDPQRKHLIGQFVRLPIVNRVVPIVGDGYVTLPDADSSDAKASYASGFLKVTPAHDPNDYEIGFRHEKSIVAATGHVLINVMAPDASISVEHGWPEQDHQQADAFLRDELVGKSREDARKLIVGWFKREGLLEETRPYRHSVGHSYRSHVAIEPYLSDQWYVAVKKQIGRLSDEGALADTDVPANSLAGLALRAMAPDQMAGAERGDGVTIPGRDRGALAAEDPDKPLKPLGVGEKVWEGHLRFYPDRYARTFQHWHEGIRDWCISRQLWWGHRIPVWRRVDAALVNATGMAPGERDPDGPMVVEDSEWTQRGCVHLEDTIGDEEVETIVCVPPGPREQETVADLEAEGFTQDPDVLDTWFSSALWPLSTMGWPRPDDFPEFIPEGDKVLEKWNPTNVLCTAREIITLWVSRMVMFNLYFSDPDLDPRSDGQRLPFYDVFIHAMIQDGHGQKMSKSLGNGVDPVDIIHSHGSDAMRFTLAHMTTQTQDVRLPVDLICPHTGEIFEPRYITAKGGAGGARVMAPTQQCPKDPDKQMVTFYGVSSGHVQATDDMPLARNTSSKFDIGRNFANKLWNAVRFALTRLGEAQEGGQAGTAGQAGAADYQLADRWILSRLARTVRLANESLSEYEFNRYAQGLYDFVWRDLCDWYIEAVKPELGERATARAVLATCVDASLRLLHPAMPFITEKLWSHLNAVVPRRGLPELDLPASEMLARAAWPRIKREWIDERSERGFELIQQVVGAARQVRTEHTVPPRQVVDISAKAPPAIAQQLLEHKALVAVLANVTPREVGPRVDRPGDAAAAVTGDIELYLHGLVDPELERQRLARRADELATQVSRLKSRLGNDSYVSKAPAHLVEQTREQLAAAEREIEAVQEQLAALA